MNFLPLQKKQKFTGSRRNTELNFFAGSTFSRSPEAWELPPPVFKHRNAFRNQADHNPALDDRKNKPEDGLHINSMSEDRRHAEDSPDLMFDITHL